MEFWLAISIIGGLVLLVGVGFIIREYLRGRIGLAAFVITIGGFAIIILIIVIGEFFWRGPQALLFTLFVPLWLAAILLARKRRM